MAGSDGDLASLLQKQQRNLNCLRDPDRTTRKRALSRMVKAFVDGNGAGYSVNVLDMFFVEHLRDGLIRVISDQVEKNRDMALSLLGYFSSKIVKDSFKLLQALLPVLQERIGSAPFGSPLKKYDLCWWRC